MADRIVEEHIVRDGGGSNSSGPLTALIIVLFLVVLLAVLYFSGVFHRVFAPHKTEIDINVKKPSAIMLTVP